MAITFFARKALNQAISFGIEAIDTALKLFRAAGTHVSTAQQLAMHGALLKTINFILKGEVKFGRQNFVC
ncbi:MAG: hypothetical protein KME29_04890 [Calothrix sp. FI2-JRJ7]|nr:hypothetical protein [Calothrix sp. FI2-JRJ7]